VEKSQAPVPSSWELPLSLLTSLWEGTRGPHVFFHGEPPEDYTFGDEEYFGKQSCHAIGKYHTPTDAAKWAWGVCNMVTKEYRYFKPVEKVCTREDRQAFLAMLYRSAAMYRVRKILRRNN
jgi:hypothetical protein